MSQASGMAGGPFVGGSKTTTNKALPVLLLALAVALGVALLQGLDDTPTVTEASLETTQAAQESATAAAAPATTTTTALAVRPPSDVKVLVSNGTSVSGVAAKINSRLQPIGYQLGTPGNTTSPMSESSVQYLAGFENEARAVATSLGLPANSVEPIAVPSPVSDIQGANVLVVIGSELAETTAQSNAATASTTPSGSSSSSGSNSSATTAAANAGLTGPLGDLSGSSGGATGSAGNSGSASG